MNNKESFNNKCTTELSTQDAQSDTLIYVILFPHFLWHYLYDIAFFLLYMVSIVIWSVLCAASTMSHVVHALSYWSVILFLIGTSMF